LIPDAPATPGFFRCALYEFYLMQAPCVLSDVNGFSIGLDESGDYWYYWESESICVTDGAQPLELIIADPPVQGPAEYNPIPPLS